MLTTIALVLSAVASVAAAPALSADRATSEKQAQSSPVSAPAKSGYVEVNGVNYYYEVHGSGEPLLLLHGGLGNIDMFGPVLPTLAEKREVIGVDLHGHGRTALGDRPIDLIAQGDDMAAIVTNLGRDKVDVLGYSLGAGVAFQFAVQHPDKVNRLVLVSGAYSQEGFYPEMLPQQAQVGAGMAEMLKDTPMYQTYAAVAPRPQDFPKLLDQMGAWMRKPYDWSAEVKELGMPVMLIYGDSDMFRPEHIVKFYQLLGGGLKDAGWMREHMSQNRLAILPNLTHYEMFMAPEMAHTALPFLNGETGAPSWAEQVEGMKE